MWEQHDKTGCACDPYISMEMTSSDLNMLNQHLTANMYMYGRARVKLFATV